jgi:hypothetical protein
VRFHRNTPGHWKRTIARVRLFFQKNQGLKAPFVLSIAAYVPSCRIPPQRCLSLFLAPFSLCVSLWMRCSLGRAGLVKSESARMKRMNASEAKWHISPMTTRQKRPRSDSPPGGGERRKLAALGGISDFAPTLRHVLDEIEAAPAARPGKRSREPADWGGSSLSPCAEDVAGAASPEEGLVEGCRTPSNLDPEALADELASFSINAKRAKRSFEQDAGLSRRSRPQWIWHDGRLVPISHALVPASTGGVDQATLRALKRLAVLVRPHLGQPNALSQPWMSDVDALTVSSWRHGSHLSSRVMQSALASRSAIILHPTLAKGSHSVLSRIEKLCASLGVPPERVGLPSLAAALGSVSFSMTGSTALAALLGALESSAQRDRPRPEADLDDDDDDDDDVTDDESVWFEAAAMASSSSSSWEQLAMAGAAVALGAAEQTCETEASHSSRQAEVEELLSLAVQLALASTRRSSPVQFVELHPSSRFRVSELVDGSWTPLHHSSVSKVEELDSEPEDDSDVDM